MGHVTPPPPWAPKAPRCPGRRHLRSKAPEALSIHEGVDNQFSLLRPHQGAVVKTSSVCEGALNRGRIQDPEKVQKIYENATLLNFSEPYTGIKHAALPSNTQGR